MSLNMADTTDMAESAFDAACGSFLSKARLDFAKRYACHFSEETHESICHKARLVRGMQEQGMSWSAATDHPDVYLGYEDRDYVSYLLCQWEHTDNPALSLNAYRCNRLIGYATETVRLAIRILQEGGE